MGLPQRYHILEWGEALTKTSSSPRIGAGQEGGALVTRGYLSHTHPWRGAHGSTKLGCKEGVTLTSPLRVSTAVYSIGTMESPEIPPAQDKQLNNYIQSQNLKKKGNFKENKGNFKENKGNKGGFGNKGEIKEIKELWTPCDPLQKLVDLFLNHWL